MNGFSSIVGNDAIKEHLIQAIDSGRVSHCYILSGEDGIGKLSLARIFAQSLQCEEREKYPCMRCHSCVQFINGSQPDVIYVRHEKPSVIGVEDVRQQLVNDMPVKPYSSPYKIYIMDEAEKMTVQAQNALLKTIEEPPAYGIILLLTTNASAFLDTIRSRSMVLQVKPVTDEQLREYLKRAGVPAEKQNNLVRFCAGNIGKAMKMAQTESFAAMVEQILHLLKHVREMDFSEMMENINALEDYRLEIYDCLGFMQMWYRDILIYKATSDLNLLIFADEFRTVNQIANRSGYEGIEKIIQAIDTARRRLDANVNFSLTMELLWMTIRENQG